MLSKEETKHIAKLARLGLSEAEIAKYQNDLAAILGYIDELKDVNIENVEPFVHSVKAQNVLRDDVCAPFPAEEIKKLIKAMAESKNGCLKVKSVFN